MRSLKMVSILAVGALFWSLGAAGAKPARCSTTDEGHFDCEFRATAKDGSFEISAPGKPTYTLNMIEPGIASGFVNVGERNIFLPGRFLRSQSEPACWINDETAVKICAH